MTKQKANTIQIYIYFDRTKELFVKIKCVSCVIGRAFVGNNHFHFLDLVLLNDFNLILIVYISMKWCNRFRVFLNDKFILFEFQCLYKVLLCLIAFIHHKNHALFPSVMLLGHSRWRLHYVLLMFMEMMVMMMVTMMPM